MRASLYYCDLLPGEGTEHRSFYFLLQREGSPTDVDVERMLAEARSESSQVVGGPSIDDDIIVQEYFSDEEHKLKEE